MSTILIKPATYIMVGILLTLTACGFMRPDYLHEISPQQLHQTLSNEDIFLIDVHIPEQKHIPGTDHHVSFFRMQENEKIFPEDKNIPIYLYCETGPMANWAARSLYDMGYKKLYSLNGGMKAWQKSGLPVKN